jgi:uncharacterized damage-inducible protein DinB
MDLKESFVKRYKLLLDFRKTVWNDLTDSSFNQMDFIKRPSEHQWSIDELLRHMLGSEIRYIQQSVDDSIEQHPKGVPAQWVGKIFFRLEEREHVPLKELKELFPTVEKKSLEILESLTEEEFKQSVKAPWGQELPYNELLNVFFAHEHQHRGQVKFIITYFRGPPKFIPKDENIEYG